MKILTEIKVVFSCQTHKLNLIPETYIYHKNEKGKPCEMDLPLLKKRYHTIFMDMICTFLLQRHAIAEKAEPNDPSPNGS